MDLKIDYRDLSPEALQGLMQNHITSGADMYDGDLEKDTERLRQLVVRGEVLIVYNQESETARLIHQDQLAEMELAFDE